MDNFISWNFVGTFVSLLALWYVSLLFFFFYLLVIKRNCKSAFIYGRNYIFALMKVVELQIKWEIFLNRIQVHTPTKDLMIIKFNSMDIELVFTKPSENIVKELKDQFDFDLKNLDEFLALQADIFFLPEKDGNPICFTDQFGERLQKVLPSILNKTKHIREKHMRKSVKNDKIRPEDIWS